MHSSSKEYFEAVELVDETARLLDEFLNHSGSSELVRILNRATADYLSDSSSVDLYVTPKPIIKKDSSVPIQISPDFSAVTIHADWWDADEVVFIKPSKGYIADTRARTNASRIPDGYTWESLQKLTPAQRQKLELFDGGDYQLTIFEECIVDWTLRFPDNPDGSKGAIIPCVKKYMAVIPDKDGTFIADEIAKRGGGVAAQVNAESDADFREPDQSVPSGGEIPGKSAPPDEASPSVLRNSRKDALVS